MIFLGRGSEAGPIWAAADVAIDATANSSWSRSGLIAISAGVPTVKLQEGVSGWSEDLDEHLPMVSGDPSRLATDLVNLARDGEARQAIARQGADVARDVDVVRVAERLAGLYRSILF